MNAPVDAGEQHVDDGAATGQPRLHRAIAVALAGALRAHGRPVPLLVADEGELFPTGVRIEPNPPKGARS